MNVVIYGATVEKITSVLDSEVLAACDCSIVGVLTDELVLGASEIKKIPIVQIDDIDSVVILLDESMPHTYRKVIEDKGILMHDLDWLLHMPEKAEPGVDKLDPSGMSAPSDDDVNASEGASDADDLGLPSDTLDSEAGESSEQARLCFTDGQAEEMRGILTAWFEKLYQAVNNTKNKDASIYNINKELQKFKDGYYGKLTSPMISEMITLREDFKKSIEDCSRFALNYEKQINYLECTVDQIDEILVTYDVAVADGAYTYNGKIIYPVADNEALESVGRSSEYPEIEKEAYTLSEGVREITDCASLEQFLQQETSHIEMLLRNNEALLKSIEMQNADLKKQLAVTDGLLIIPLLRKIIKMKLAFLNKREILESTREETEAIYTEAYEHGITCAESILTSLGVNIRSNIDDTYDPKYHRILKMQKILPEEAEKDKRIATFITDCYVSDERVVAPAKVIVYKL